MSDNLNITKQQYDCIYHDKGNVIVSASAGSGKTFVIINRIIRLVAEKGVGVEKILATTFTKLAANEMKEKLKKALIEKFNETGDLRFKNELTKVANASISTIHSFLGDLLRRYFYVVGLDANFEILDEKKSKKYSSLAIDELFLKLYEEGDEEFLKLLNVYSSKRKDSKLKELILKVYEFSEAELSLEDLRKKSLALQTKVLNDLEEGERENHLKNVEENCEIINAIINLTIKFKEEYDLLKREENYVDFCDLERLVLKLFEDKEVLQSVKNSYEYIFVDEYQDVNSVQEQIISLLENDNLFMVGDSKQSIYGFRGCNPEFFINKYEKYKKKDGGIAINLDKNFRSTKAVLNAVNNVFSRVMTKEIGGNQYLDNLMEYGGGYPSYDGEVVIHLLDDNPKKTTQDTEFLGVYSVIENSNKQKETNYGNEELYIVKLIGDLIGKTYYDSKEKRQKKIEFKDICILTRSLKGFGSSIVKTLIDFKIPVSSGVKNSIASYPEVKAIYSVVESICSLENDVSLATVMLNFKDFSETELALIRKIGGRDIKFFECLLKAKESSEYQGLANKVSEFILWFDKIRLVSEYQTADEVLRRVIKETNFDVKLKLSAYGKAKLSRVERFISESNLGGNGLKILEFYDYLQDALDEISILESEGEDTVKIMTAHSSKGLEFPIVIVAGTDRLFNSKDKSMEVIRDREFGLAPKSYNLDDMLVSENLARDFLKDVYSKKRAVEEARLLYVELTRAQCELHILCKKSLKEEVSEEDFVSANSQLNYLSRNDATVYEVTEADYEKVLSVNEGSPIEEAVVIGKEKDPFITEVLKKNLSFKYDYITETTMPVKQSVSELNTDDEYYKVTNLFGTSSSEKGTAYHRFFELCSFCCDSVEKELNEFKNNGLITKEQFELLDVNKLKSILKMDVFSQIKGKEIFKEQKFCYFVSARELGYNSDESVLIQGIIDLLVISGDGVWLLDYKLSSIEREEDFIKAYKKQMYLYKRAIEKVLNKKVEKVILINILQEKIVSLDV